MNIESKKILLKSKSSYTATPKTEAGDKAGRKWRSNGDFNTSVVRKRGVYVERATAKSGCDTRITVMQESTEATQAKYGKRNFYSSVLSINSKTAPIPYSFEGTSRNAEPKNAEDDKFRNLLDLRNGKKKRVYKSKVLNGRLNDEDDIIVLKKQRQVEDTSSNLLYLSHTNIESEETISNEVRPGNRGLVKEVDFASVEEPVTLVASNKKDDHVYKLFVDLLTTTLEANPTKGKEKEEDRFQMEAAVADRLTLKENQSSDTDFEEASEEIRLDTNPDVFYTENILSIDNDDRPYKTTDKRKNTKKKRTKNATPKRNNTKDNKVFNKQELIKILEKELAEDSYLYREPQNFYEALVSIAATKRRNAEQHMKNNFDDTESSADEDDDKHNCSYRNSSAKTKKPKRKVKINKKLINNKTVKNAKVNNGFINHANKGLNANANNVFINPNYFNDVDYSYEEFTKPTSNIVMFDSNVPQLKASDNVLQVFRSAIGKNDSITNAAEAEEKDEASEQQHKSLETDFDFDSSVSNFSLSQSESFIAPSDFDSDEF